MVGAEMSPHPISTHDWVSSLMTRAINHSQEGLKLAGRAELEGEFLLILAHHFFSFPSFSPHFCLSSHSNFSLYYCSLSICNGEHRFSFNIITKLLVCSTGSNFWTTEIKGKREYLSF